MKRNHILLVLVVLLSMVLTACATGVEPTATVVVPPTVAATEEVVVTDEVEATEEAEAVETEEAVATDEAVETEEAAVTEEADAVETEEAEGTEVGMLTTQEAVETEAVEADATEEVEAVETEEVEAVETEEVEAVETEEVEAVETEEVEADATEEVEAVETEEVEAVETEEVEAVETEEAVATDEAVVSGGGDVTSVCLVTDVGRVNDGSFNQSAYEGMLRAAEEFSLDETYIETQNPADYAANIQTCLDNGAGVVVTVGFLIADATLSAAEANPDVYFIGVDQFFTADAPDNVVGLQFREDQAGFLAGAMAGLVTESNIIGGVYGEEIPPVIKFRHGFEAGARHVNPDVELLGVYISSFVAPAEGAAAAENFIGEGADVIFGAGGPTGSGGILRAAELGVKVIGVDQDEYFTTFGGGETPGSEFIITSAVKGVDEGVYQMLDALTEGNFEWPTEGVYVLDASVDGIGFAPANGADVPEEVTEQVQAIFEELKSGELETGIDPVTGALLDGGEEVEAVETEEAEAVETEEAAVVETEEADMAATEEAAVVETEEAADDMAATEEADAVATEDVEMAATEDAAADDMAATEEADDVVAGDMGETLDLSGTITSVCLVTDLGRINDGSFNQSAYNGMALAAEELSLDSTFIETQNVADYAANIQTCLDNGAEAVVTVGFLIADATLAAAEANPDVYFIGVDQFFTADVPDNIVGLQFREDQAGFLAGAMAGLMTESNVIGGVYGEEIPPVVKFRHGFEAGARYVNPDVEILGVYIASFLAPAEGAAAAENFIGEGADVIFGAGGPTGSGGILRAAELGVKVIGVDQDEYFTTFGGGETPGSEFIITSAVKAVDEGVYQMLDALSAGNYQWPTGGIYVLDASVDGITFAPANAADVPEEVTEQVQAIFEELKSGELETGVDPVTGALLDGEASDEAEVEATEAVEGEETPEATPES